MDLQFWMGHNPLRTDICNNNVYTDISSLIVKRFLISEHIKYSWNVERWCERFISSTHTGSHIERWALTLSIIVTISRRRAKVAISRAVQPVCKIKWFLIDLSCCFRSSNISVVKLTSNYGETTALTIYMIIYRWKLHGNNI